MSLCNTSNLYQSYVVETLTLPRFQFQFQHQGCSEEISVNAFQIFCNMSKMSYLWVDDRGKVEFIFQRQEPQMMCYILLIIVDLIIRCPIGSISIGMIPSSMLETVFGDM
jgi:hypothetical protein